MKMTANSARTVLFWAGSIIYLIAVQFIRAIWQVKLYLQNGDSLGNSIGTGFLIAAVLFLPGIIYIAAFIKRSSIRSLLEYLIFSLRKNKWKYIVYILIVCFLCINYGEGYLYMEGRYIGGSIQLEPLRSSYILMSVCHYLFADIASIVYLLLIPFVCSVFNARSYCLGNGGSEDE